MTKIVVLGGTGLIGSKVVARLAEHGHAAIAASPSSGVNTLTGEGLAEVLSGAQVVVDVSNSPSFEAKAALVSSRPRPATSSQPKRRLEPARSQSVADSAPPQGVRFVEQGELSRKGFAHPVRLLEACRA